MTGWLIGLAMLLGAPTETMQIDVGTGNWAALPALKAKGVRLPTPDMITRMERLLADGECRFEGQSSRRFDITVPYAVLVEPDGRARRAIVAQTGCAALEAYVGGVVLKLARRGDFDPTGEREARWYGSEVNFNLQ
jgi:hypothetical protein